MQDLGRTGYRALGINTNGVMDIVAARIINTLLRNAENEAVLEMHFPAAEITFEAECTFAIGGADFAAELNGTPVSNWGSKAAKAGDRLRFIERRSGNRAYLAVAGGFEIREWLGSGSTNLTAGTGGIDGRRLAAGDAIGLKSPCVLKPKTVGPSIVPRYSRFPTVRVVAGGEFDLLTAVSEREFLSGGFTLTKDSNRMGYRLAGEPLHLLHAKEMVSAAVSFGTIQLLPDGQLIVLMADHQTSGGYPRVANVISADLPLLAQLGPGDGVSFHLVSIEEAENASIRFERELCYLRLGARMT